MLVVSMNFFLPGYGAYWHGCYKDAVDVVNIDEGVPDNVVRVCKSCNSSKGAKGLYEVERA